MRRLAFANLGKISAARIFKGTHAINPRHFSSIFSRSRVASYHAVTVEVIWSVWERLSSNIPLTVLYQVVPAFFLLEILKPLVRSPGDSIPVPAV